MKNEKIVELCKEVIKNDGNMLKTSCWGIYCTEDKCPFSSENNRDINCGNDTDISYLGIAKKYLNENIIDKTIEEDTEIVNNEDVAEKPLDNDKIDDDSIKKTNNDTNNENITIIKKDNAEMNNMFNWNDFKNGQIYVHCNTEEKAKNFIKKCYENDCKWIKSNSNETHFDVEGKDICYRIGRVDNTLIYGNINDLAKVLPIIEWKIENENQIKETLEFCKKVIEAKGNVYSTRNGVNCDIDCVNCPLYNIDCLNPRNYDINVEIAKKHIKEHEKDNNMEKTFTELAIRMKDITEQEIWENKDINRMIMLRNDDIYVRNLDGSKYNDIYGILFSNNIKYTLQRKQYIFPEVFESLEEGNEIESCESGHRFKMVKGELKFCSDISKEWHITNTFRVEEIYGKWYIND